MQTKPSKVVAPAACSEHRRDGQGAHSGLDRSEREQVVELHVSWNGCDANRTIVLQSGQSEKLISLM